MSRLLNRIPRPLPALTVMLVIFLFSSRSSDELPYYGDWEYFVKKSSHVFIYGILALSYLHALPAQKNVRKNYFLAWVLSIIYALTDEFHQSFVPGRRASIVDVILFDNIGAMIALFLHSRFSKSRDTAK